MNVALDLVIEEAVTGRNYYSGENWVDHAAIETLVHALRQLGCIVRLDSGGFIMILRYPDA